MKDLITRLQQLVNMTQDSDFKVPEVGEAIEMITYLSREKVIYGVVQGGVFDVVSDMPPGVRLVVHDYDIQDVDEDRWIEDENGNSCVEIEFANRG